MTRTEVGFCGLYALCCWQGDRNETLLGCECSDMLLTTCCFFGPLPGGPELFFTSNCCWRWQHFKNVLASVKPSNLPCVFMGTNDISRARQRIVRTHISSLLPEDAVRRAEALLLDRANHAKSLSLAPIQTDRDPQGPLGVPQRTECQATRQGVLVAQERPAAPMACTTHRSRSPRPTKPCRNGDCERGLCGNKLGGPRESGRARLGRCFTQGCCSGASCSRQGARRSQAKSREDGFRSCPTRCSVPLDMDIHHSWWKPDPREQTRKDTVCGR